MKKVNILYQKISEHIGHKIVCVYYGTPENMQNVAVECEDCNEVIIDEDK